MGLDGFTAREDGMWAQRVAGSEGERLCCRLGIVIEISDWNVFEVCLSNSENNM